MTNRSNQEWLEALAGAPPDRDQAIEDLRTYLVRGLGYALSSRSNVRQSDIQDFVQDAILRILSALDSFRGESRFTTWAQKIAIRVAFSELRRRRWRDVPLEAVRQGEEGEYVPELAIDDTAGPEQRAMQSMAMDVVQRTISEDLTDRQRQAMVAILVQGMPLFQVAEKMGSNRNAMYKLLHDARKRLKRRLVEAGLSADEILDVFEAETT